MWTSDEKVALDDIYRGAQRLADAYHDGASLVEDATLRSLFEQLARSRERLARAVAALAQKSAPDHEPAHEPDPDRMDLARLGRRIKAAASADARVTLVDDRLGDERELAASIDRAAGLDVAPTARDVMDDWKRSVDEASHHLSRARNRLGHG